MSSVAFPGHSGDLEVAYGLSVEAAYGLPGRATVDAAYECQTWDCRAVVEISSLLMGVKRGLARQEEISRLLFGVKRGLAGPQWRSRGCLWVSRLAWPGHSADLELLVGVTHGLARPQCGSRGCLWVESGGCLWSNVARPGNNGGLVHGCQTWPCRAIVQIWR